MSTTALPPIIQEMANIIGLPGALRLATMFGGRQIEILGRIKGEIAEALGEKAAHDLAFHFRALSIYIPMARQSVIRARDAEIVRRFSEMTTAGMSARSVVTTLAAEYGTCERNVWYILKKPCPDTQE